MKRLTRKITNYHSQFFLGFVLLMMIIAGLVITLSSKETYEKKEIEASEVVANGDFRLTADNRWDGTMRKSYAELNWDDVSDLSSDGYRLYQSIDGNNWDIRSTRYGDEIEVLNIYPDIYENDIRDWMSNPDIGLDLINVTPVSMTDFNSDPVGNLRNSQNNEYQYDVIFVGTANMNNNVSFNENAVDELIDFIEAGRGLLVGHDVLSDNTRGWMGVTADLSENNRLAPYLGIGLRNQEALGETYPGASEVIIVNNGYLMKYPHEMKDNQELSIPLTHSFGQVAGSQYNGTIWLEFINPGDWDLSRIYDEPDSTTNFYLVTNGNAGMIQTGHSSESVNRSTEDEQKIIANTLYNLAQVTLQSNADDHTVKDEVIPSRPELIIRCGSEDNINIQVDAKDNGQEYQWYIEANTKNDGVKTSDRVKETITSNIAGYFYEVTDSPNTTLADRVKDLKDQDAHSRIDPNEYDLYVAPDDNSVEYETAATFTLNEKNTSGRYLHVLAVDRANNISAVSSQQIRDITQPVDFEVERTADEARLVEVAIDNSIGDRMKSIEIQIPRNTEIKDFNSLNLPTDWYSFENSETTNYYSFSFAMEDNNSVATIQTFLEGLRFTINDPVNDAGSIKVILHERVYTSWIDPSGVTHYYVFMPEMSAPGRTWFEAYNSAKRIQYRGLTGYLATITSEDEHDFIYDNIANEPGFLGGTRSVFNDGTRISDDSNISQDEPDYDIAQENWYWANGPEAGDEFYVGITGGHTPGNAYSRFATGEPNNGGAGYPEYVLQFAFYDGKDWNDVPGSLPYTEGANHGYYVEFSEYGDQVETEDLTDVCWNAAIPQKIILHGYTERFGQTQRFNRADIVYDQQLRIGNEITVQPNDFELYEFLELRDRIGDIVLGPLPLDVPYTVSNVLQEGALIYENRQVRLHVRQVVLEPNNQLVNPEEGHLNLKTSIFDSSSHTHIEDNNQLIQTRIPSQGTQEVPDFETIVVSTKHMTDQQDQLTLDLVLPEFYEYLGHFWTPRHFGDPNDPMGADHQDNTETDLYSGSFERPRMDLDRDREYFVTLYIKPTTVGQSPQPYSWDYKHNNLGEIKTE